MSEEEIEIEEERQPDRIVEHRLIKMDEKPPKSKRKGDLQNQLDERDAQMVTLISHNLDLEKGLAKDRFPDEKYRIENVQDHQELEALLEQLDENYVAPTKPKGKVTLPPTQKLSGLDSGATHGDLINRIYLERNKTKGENKQEATEKIDKLFDSMKNLTADKVGRIMRGSQYSTCVNCDAIVNLDEYDITRKGTSCPSCGRRTGIDAIKRINKLH